MKRIVAVGPVPRANAGFEPDVRYYVATSGGAPEQQERLPTPGAFSVWLSS